MGKNSHFEVINGNDLKLYKDRILQIETDKQYENNNGYGVYIAEVSDEEVKDE
jgi:hypothetical protein